MYHITYRRGPTSVTDTEPTLTYARAALALDFIRGEWPLVELKFNEQRIALLEVSAEHLTFLKSTVVTPENTHTITTIENDQETTIESYSPKRILERIRSAIRNPAVEQLSISFHGIHCLTYTNYATDEVKS